MLESILDLSAAEKEQRAAFIVSPSSRDYTYYFLRPNSLLSCPVPQRDERVMVVWSDAVGDIISSVLDVEARLLKLVWKQRPGAATPNSLLRASVFASMSHSSLPNKKVGDIELTEKDPMGNLDVPSRGPSSVTKDKELEEGVKLIPRPTRILAPIYVGLATALSACELSFTASSREHFTDLTFRLLR